MFLFFKFSCDRLWKFFVLFSKSLVFYQKPLNRFSKKSLYKWYHGIGINSVFCVPAFPVFLFTILHLLQPSKTLRGRGKIFDPYFWSFFCFSKTSRFDLRFFYRKISFIESIPASATTLNFFHHFDHFSKTLLFSVTPF